MLTTVAHLLHGANSLWYVWSLAHQILDEPKAAQWPHGGFVHAKTSFYRLRSNHTQYYVY